MQLKGTCVVECIPRQLVQCNKIQETVARRFVRPSEALPVQSVQGRPRG